jgi:kumamolisin
LLNAGLYNLERLGFSFGRDAVLNTISAGDNWFYNGRNGYSPAVRLGTVDVFNLSQMTH